GQIGGCALGGLPELTISPGPRLVAVHRDSRQVAPPADRFPQEINEGSHGALLFRPTPIARAQPARATWPRLSGLDAPRQSDQGARYWDRRAPTRLGSRGGRRRRCGRLGGGCEPGRERG